MAYFYNEDVYNTQDDVKDLQQRIENNFDALVKNFQGPTQPNVIYTGQLWYDTSEGKIKIRSSAGWVEIFDVSNQAAPIGDGSVTSPKISSAARKGSIVEGQSISPSSCSIKSVPTCAGYPFRGSSEASVSLQATSGTTYFLAGKIYVPPSSTEFVVFIEMSLGLITKKADVVVIVGGSTSSAPIPSTSISYRSITLDVTSVAGWVDFQVGARSTSGPSATVYYRGYTMTSGASL